MALYAFDGTWNDSSLPESQRDTKADTNVHRFRTVYKGTVEYIDGVGTRHGSLGKMIGGITGAGSQKRLTEQFAKLKENFNAGDTTVDIIGYSRGAAIARIFVHYIGLNYELISKNGDPLNSPPTIRFLGLFDTVASFGLPWTNKESGFERDIPEFVENTYHAMALDETRETFGIERCMGNREKITEVWFRGGHGDIGGNATFAEREIETSNSLRTNITLEWMLDKARALNLPITNIDSNTFSETHNNAPITALDEKISIGKVGTLSRRIHMGDLVHHSLEKTELTRGIDGRQLRRIDVLTRIEDGQLQKKFEALNWIPPIQSYIEPDNIPLKNMSPTIVQLSLRRYPFDCPPARTWSAWMQLWKIEDKKLISNRGEEFWAPTDADRALAWDIYVEMRTRITIQSLDDEEGDDIAVLTSIHQLFSIARESMRSHGVQCANTSTLITIFLNDHVREFTTKWHRISRQDKWENQQGLIHKEFRTGLKETQKKLKIFASALSHLANANIS